MYDLYEDYLITSNEQHFEEFVKKAEGYIKWRIRQRGFRKEEEDIKQLILIELWKGGKYYDRTKSNPKTYFENILNRTIGTYIYQQSMGKRSMVSRSLNEEIDERELQDFIPDNHSMEDAIINQLVLVDNYYKFLENLTEIEKKVFKVHLVTYKTLITADYGQLMKYTGLPRKTIDNALQRIKHKAEKVS